MASNNLLNLCQFIAELTSANIPPHVLEHAKLLLLDTLGVILAGSKSEEAGRTSQQLSVNFTKKTGGYLSRKIRSI